MKNNNQWYKENISRNMKENESKAKQQIKYEKANKKTAENRITLVIALIIILIFLVFLIFFYKPNSIDILEELKKTFTNLEILMLAIIVSSIVIINLVVKDKRNLSNLLKIVLAFNIVVLIVSFFIEFNLNKTYNSKEEFERLYDTKIENKTDTEYVDLWKTFLEQEVHTKTEKEVFIEENISQYRYFKIRVYLVFILYVVTMMANTYIISKIDKGIKGRDILERNDKILFKNKVNIEKER